MLKSRQQYNILKKIFSILYLAILIYSVFFARRRRGLHIHSLNLTPVKNLWADFSNLPNINQFKYFTDLFGNIVLFMPVSFVLAFLFKEYKFVHVVLIGFALSFTIELLQYTFMIGYADIDDIILNTIGTGIGYYFFTIFKKLEQQTSF